MAARALLVCMLAGSAQAFTFPSSLPLHAQSPSSCHVLKHSRLTLRARKAEEDVRAQESDAQPTSVGAERNWFERTTSADRESRVGGDPLAPKSRPVINPPQGSRWSLEEESNEWYKNQDKKRSMFGRTLNPLNGSLEKKDETAQTMNLLEDPIFYLILIVAAPVAILFGAAATCVAPALSLAFGFQCSW